MGQLVLLRASHTVCPSLGRWVMGFQPRGSLVGFGFIIVRVEVFG